MHSSMIDHQIAQKSYEQILIIQIAWYLDCSLHLVNESYDWLLFRKKKWIEINLSYMYALLWIGKNHFEWSLHLTLYQKPWKLTENSVHLYFITCIHIWFYKIVFISAADKQEYYINVHRSLDQNKKMYVEFFKNKKKSKWLSTCSLADIVGRVEKPSGKFFNEQYTSK